MIPFTENQRDYPKTIEHELSALASHVDDPAVIEYFHYSFDEWDARFAPQMVESTLNKFSNLLFSDVLRYSFGQKENSLRFDEFLRDGTRVIFNLGGVRREIKNSSPVS